MRGVLWIDLSIRMCVILLGRSLDRPPFWCKVAFLLGRANFTLHVMDLVTCCLMWHMAAGETAPDSSHMRRSASGEQLARSCWKGCFPSWPSSWAEPQSMEHE